jgi:hypothetical protein
LQVEPGTRARRHVFVEAHETMARRNLGAAVGHPLDRRRVMPQHDIGLVFLEPAHERLLRIRVDDQRRNRPDFRVALLERPECRPPQRN